VRGDSVAETPGERPSQVLGGAGAPPAASPDAGLRADPAQQAPAPAAGTWTGPERRHRTGGLRKLERIALSGIRWVFLPVAITIMFATTALPVIGLRTMAVTTGSMRPVIQPGDAVVVRIRG